MLDTTHLPPRLIAERIYKYYCGPAVGNVYATEAEGDKITAELIRRGVIAEADKPSKHLVVITTFDKFFTDD